MVLLKSEPGYFLSLILLVALLTGCEQNSGIKTEQGLALGTNYTIKYEVAHDSITYHDEIESIFEQVNSSMSTYLTTSDISRINQGDSTLVVDTLFKEVFIKAKEVWEASEGIFDPTVGILVNAYGFGPDVSLSEINREVVDSLMPLVGFEQVVLTDDNRILKERSDIFLDFNALAKGYTIDLIGRMLDAKGVENYLIELGGEILTRGQNTQRVKNWTVAIDSPLQDGDQRTFIVKVQLENQAMATSGNYRKFRVDPETGEHYVHIVNPKTGFPEKSNILSVSVIAPTCMEADAYATALMLMDLDKSKALLKAHPELEAYIISSEGGEGENSLQEFTTEGFRALIVE
ncbi:FAD:protein FMN transferase [Robertkochia aurantiaca]|uniref:FAD:protein FMN transferase n=1 Tax=Robertkochia aurantiaca TaxID=2873700 RepID=UPI001CC9132A|nr:FAD:protein FMN transferase [Robertkochia sp. 3YJGBD-33]